MARSIRGNFSLKMKLNAVARERFNLKYYVAHLSVLSLGIASITALPAYSQDLNSCDDPFLSAEDTEKCLQDLSEKASFESASPTEFPATIHADMYYEAEKRFVPVFIESKDGKNILIKQYLCDDAVFVCTQQFKPLHSFNQDRIYSYYQEVLGDGSTSAQALTGVAISAAIMPILAPFQAMTTNRRLRRFLYVIQRVSEDGFIVQDKIIGRSFVPVADRYHTFFSTITGMSSGEKRSIDEIKPFLVAGIDRLMPLIDADQNKLTLPIPGKPWCSKDLSSQYPL